MDQIYHRPDSRFVFLWYGNNQVNDGSPKSMYLRAQASSCVSLEEEIMVVGRKERTGRDTAFTNPLYDLHLAQFRLSLLISSFELGADLYTSGLSKDN